MRKYDIEFDFTTVSKRGIFEGKSGECNITTPLPIEALKESEELKLLIAADMEKKTKKKVFLVDIKAVKLVA